MPAADKIEVRIVLILSNSLEEDALVASNFNALASDINGVAFLFFF